VISGVDCSNVNGHLDLAALTREHSLSFVFFKATEGRGFRDPLFPAAWAVIGDLGLVRGSYHFAHPMTDAAAQADAFLSYVRGAGLLDTDLLALDLEVNDNRPAPMVAAWAQEWCSRVHAESGRKPVVYTFLDFARQGNCAGLGSYPLWIADPSSTPGRPRVPAPWKTWSVHQYGQQGLDLDVANYPDAASMTAALAVPPQEGWTARMIADLPVLSQGAADKAGQVFFVNRLQSLVQCYGRINDLAAAACIGVTGTFDAETAAGVRAVQAHKGLVTDSTVGPKTWGVLIAGVPA
jgi:lysozyme